MEQGREDLKAAIAVGTAAPSTVAMLLQMVFEKMGKSAALKLGTPLKAVEKSHHVTSHLIATIAANPALLPTPGGGGAAVWTAVLPLVQELEDLHPVTPLDMSSPKSHKPRLPRKSAEMLEFPWVDATPPHHIRWPARDLPIALRFASATNTELAQLLTFATALSVHHDTLFHHP